MDEFSTDRIRKGDIVSLSPHRQPDDPGFFYRGLWKVMNFRYEEPPNVWLMLRAVDEFGSDRDLWDELIGSMVREISLVTDARAVKKEGANQ